MTTPQPITSDTWTDPTKTRNLDDAVRVLQDGVYGYQAAAEEVSDPSTAAILRQLGESRQEALERVMAVAVDETRVTPDEENGSVTGAIHRGWLKLKGTFAGDEAVIEAAKTGESEAIDRLEDVLGADFDSPVEEAVRRAMLDVEQAREKLNSIAS